MKATRWTPIYEVVSEASTWNPRTSRSTESIRYIDISSVNAEDKTLTDVRTISPADAPSRARQIVRTNDVLVSTVRPNLNAVAIVPPDLDKATATTGFAVLRPNPALLDARYLFHWVRSPGFVRHLTGRATGASYPAVTERVVRESKLPLPNLAEQSRIAATLDKADVIRRKRRESVALLDAVLRSAFLETFGDPLKNEKGWQIASLGDMAWFTGGGTPSRAVRAFYTGPIPWASSKDFTSEDLLDTQEHVTPEAIEKSAARIVPIGSILIVVKSKILLHRLPVAIARTAICFSQDIKAITPRDDRVPATYLARHLRVGQQALLNKARGANTEGLTLEHLRNYQVMLPPPNLVKRWDSVEIAISALRGSFSEHLAMAISLFDALGHRAFHVHHST